MRDLLTILLVAAACSSATFAADVCLQVPYPAPKCPPISGGNAVHLGNPYDCATFWQCTELGPCLKQCMKGLLWNEKLEACDWPANVNCKEIPYPKEVRADLPNGCPDIDGVTQVFFKHPTDCAAYFQCVNRERVLRRCPDELQWNDPNKYCDFPANVNCDGVTTTSTTTPQPDLMCIGQPDGTLLADPQDCSKYYICSKQQAHSRQCTDGLLWHDVMNWCDYPQNVECNGRPQPEPPVTELLPNGCPSIDGTIGYLYPNPADCAAYFHCVKGALVLKRCNANLQWSIIYNGCDYPENVDCRENTNAGEQAKICSSLTTGTVLTDPFRCKNYYYCMNNIAHSRECPGNYLWNSSQGKCDVPQSVDCGTRP